MKLLKEPNSERTIFHYEIVSRSLDAHSPWLNICEIAVTQVGATDYSLRIETPADHLYCTLHNRPQDASLQITNSSSRLDISDAKIVRGVPVFRIVAQTEGKDEVSFFVVYDEIFVWDINPGILTSEIGARNLLEL